MKPLLQDALLATIQSAIIGHQVIQFEINNTWRTVEPYQLGLQKGEKALSLYGYCRDVVSDDFTPSRWQVFSLEAMKHIELTNYCFQPHVDYDGKADLMTSVFCKLQGSHSWIDFIPISGPYSNQNWAMLFVTCQDGIYLSVN